MLTKLINIFKFIIIGFSLIILFLIILFFDNFIKNVTSSYNLFMIFYITEYLW
jgi:hypothetical protein